MKMGCFSKVHLQIGCLELFFHRYNVINGGSMSGFTYKSYHVIAFLHICELKLFLKNVFAILLKQEKKQKNQNTFKIVCNSTF